MVGTSPAGRGGLEAALIDNAPQVVPALEEVDSRRFKVSVTGPAALIVAKMHKIGDRLGHARRSDNKDAYDVFRLLQAVETDELAARFRSLVSDPVSAVVTREAIARLEALFRTPTGRGAQMAARVVEGIGDPEFVVTACAALTDDLLSLLQ